MEVWVKHVARVFVLSGVDYVSVDAQLVESILDEYRFHPQTFEIERIFRRQENLIGGRGQVILARAGIPQNS